MKFVILIALFIGVSFAYPSFGPAYYEQLLAFGTLAESLQSVSGAVNSLNGHISRTGDASVLTVNITEAINAINAIAGNVSVVATAISFGEVLSSINDGFEDLSDAEFEYSASISGIVDGSGSVGSFADLISYAKSLQYLSVAFSVLHGVIDGLPGDSAVAFGTVADDYGLISSLNSLASAELSIAGTISVAAIKSENASELDSLANAVNHLSSTTSNLAAAFVNAKNK